MSMVGMQSSDVEIGSQWVRVMHPAQAQCPLWQRKEIPYLCAHPPMRQSSRPRMWVGSCITWEVLMRVEPSQGQARVASSSAISPPWWPRRQETTYLLAGNSSISFQRSLWSRSPRSPHHPCHQSSPRILSLKRGKASLYFKWSDLCLKNGRILSRPHWRRRETQEIWIWSQVTPLRGTENSLISTLRTSLKKSATLSTLMATWCIMAHPCSNSIASQ